MEKQLKPMSRTSKVKPGDKVICLYKSSFLMEHEQFCKVGLDYEVEEFRVMTYGIEPNGTRPKYPEIRIKGDTEHRWYDARRFAKVQS